MKRIYVLFLFTVTLRITVFSQLSLEMTPALQAELDSIPELILTEASENTTLPESVDNATQIWMRGILDQVGDNSCAQAAGIGYTFTYEINRLRNIPSSDNVNRYPVDFTYNFLNGGNNEGSFETHGWMIVEQIGCPNIDTYEPGGDGFVEGTKWISGYDKYFSGIDNRIDTFFKINLWTHFNDLKHWIADHGTSDSTGGIATFTAKTSYNVISRDTIRYDSEEEAGKWIVKNWGNTDSSHTMTIVGYNDNIMYPLNDDNVYRNDFDNNEDDTIDIRDWEIGAVKVANSWGNGWPNSNQGFIYVPYRLLFDLGINHKFSKAYVINALTTIEPEIVLKVEVKNNNRGDLTFKAGGAENSNSDLPTFRRTYNAFANHGGSFPMQGQNNFDTLETALDFSYWFADRVVGKVFFQVYQAGSVNGYINKFSLVDYRWNEVLEVPCDSIFPFITIHGYNTLAINYDVLPFLIHPWYTDLDTITTDKVVRKQTVVKSGATLTIESFNNIDFYNSELVIEPGAILVVGSNVQFHAKQGICKITINGNITIGSNVKFSADSGSTLEINFGINPVNINGCFFANCAVNSSSDPINISNSTFTNSTFSAINNTWSWIPYTLNLIHNTFTTNDPLQTAIYVNNYTEFNIDENTIHGYYNGISLNNSGSSTNINRTINDNSIDACAMYGVSIYNSAAALTKNHLYNNKRGIGFLDRSNVAFYGNPNTTTYDEMNIVENDTCYEVFASAESFPWYFNYNAIFDPDNSGGQTDALIYYEGSPFHADVRFNCWDNNFNPSIDLYPNGYMVDPTYCPPGDGLKSTEIALDDYLEALEYFENGQYTDAKTSFESVIQQYPKTQYAEAAMKELFSLEKFVDNDYSTLQQYYQTNDSIQTDTVLTKLAIFLSNKCEIELQNWQTAIDHFENIIENPESPEDSIFAIIDLGYTYLLMGDSGYKSTAQGRLLEHKPASPEAFSSKRDYLISLLPFEKSGSTSETLIDMNKQGELLQNIPNPFSNTTSIQFNLNSGDFSSIEIRIHDQVGKEVMHIPVKSAKEGSNTVELNMQGLPSGIYYYSLIVNGTQADTKKMVVVR